MPQTVWVCAPCSDAAFCRNSLTVCIHGGAKSRPSVTRVTKRIKYYTYLRTVGAYLLFLLTAANDLVCAFFCIE